MFEVREGDIFASGCEALVNPVNISPGMMGALAGVFARRFPGLQAEYLEAVKAGATGVGVLVPFLVPAAQDSLPVSVPGCRLVINFPTTPTFGASSDLDLIRAGLKNLGQVCTIHKVVGLAIPALGCGVGGLDWADVLYLLREWHEQECPEGLTRVLVYKPQM